MQMAVKVLDRWACSYCGTEYNTSTKADSCRDRHELIYVPLSKGDLNRLINFIYIRDDKLLTPTLISSLTKYLRGN